MLGAARDASARRGALGLAALVALAAVVRIVAWARSGAIFDDGPVFLYLAQALLDGDVGAVLRHPYHPGYPAAVAAVYASGVAPSLEVAGVAVSIAAGALAVALLFVFVRDTFDEGAAWIAAALLALHPPSVEFSSDVQSDALYAALFLASAVAAWRGLRDARIGWAAAAGALAGGAYLVRPEGLGIALAGIAGGAWLGLVGSWGRRGALAWCAAFAVAAAAVAGPYAAALRAQGGGLALTQKKSLTALVGIDIPAFDAAAGGSAEPVASPSAPPAPPAPAGAVAARAIPSNGPLPGSELAALAAEPAPPASRIGEGLYELGTAALSALRVEIASFLLVGLLVARGRPGRRALFVGAAVALYTVVLFGLGASAGYVSSRHALPPLLLAFGYLAVGGRALGAATLFGLARAAGRGPVAPGRARAAGALAAVAVAAAFFVPRDLGPRRTDRVAEREAAEWLAETVGSPVPPVASRRLRDAWYARARFVPIPVEGYAGASLLEHLRRSGARYAVIDAARVDDHAGLREAIALGMQRLHVARAHGREAWVLAIAEPPRAVAVGADGLDGLDGVDGAGAEEGRPSALSAQ
ncbi:MAG: glycosyltransferase family 39 protein [Myxococcota bacterium]